MDTERRETMEKSDRDDRKRGEGGQRPSFTVRRAGRDEMNTTTPTHEKRRRASLLAIAVAGLLACCICIAGCSESPSGEANPGTAAPQGSTPTTDDPSSPGNRTEIYAPGENREQGLAPNGTRPGGEPPAGFHPNGTPPAGGPTDGVRPNGTPLEGEPGGAWSNGTAPGGPLPARKPPGDASDPPPAAG